MAEEEKQRFYRAKKQIGNILKKSQYNVTFLSNHIFDLEAVREKEVRKIKVVLDEIKLEDIKQIEKIKLPINFTKEIWCKKSNKKDFFVNLIKV